MKVTGTSRWERRFGYLGSSLVCQVTRVQFLDGQVGYVRENIRNCSGLHVSSSHRLGITGGIINGKVRTGTIPKEAVQVLELAAPKSVWQHMAKTVRQLDKLKRPVILSRNWTVRKALSLRYEIASSV